VLTIITYDNHILAVTATQAHDKQALPQDLARSFERHTDACLLRAEQIPCRHALAFARVVYRQVLFQPQPKRDGFPTQEGQPIDPDELSARTNKFNTLPPEQPVVIFDQGYALCGIRAAFLLEDSPQQRGTDAFLTATVCRIRLLILEYWARLLIY
jgi:hypothetical protein